MTNELKYALAGYLSEFITKNRRRIFDRVLKFRTRYLTVALDEVADPLDANAVMRSCECFGVQDLHVVPNDSKFRTSKGVAVGSAKWISLHRYPAKSEGGTQRCLATLRDKGYGIASVSEHGRSIKHLDLSQPWALLFNANEHTRSGLQPRVDEEVSIPTVGFSNTFNISVRVALCLHHLRSRLQAEAHPWPLSKEETLDLELDWLARMPKRIGRITERFMSDNHISREAMENAGISPETLQHLLGRNVPTRD